MEEGAAAVVSLQEEQKVQEDVKPRTARSPAEHNAWMQRMARKKEEQDRAAAAEEYERRQRSTSSSSGASVSGLTTGTRKKTYGPGRGEVESKPCSAKKAEPKSSSAQKALPEVMAMIKVYAAKPCTSHAEYL